MTEAQRCMLDTNVFNDLLSGKLSFEHLGKQRFIVTGIQRNELDNTRDEEKRAKLLGMFDKVAPDIVLASSFAFDIEGAGWDQAHWNDDSGKFALMLQRLRELDGPNRPPLNQERDILIAETCIKLGAVLLSRDENLCRVIREFGGRAVQPPKSTG